MRVADLILGISLASTACMALGMTPANSMSLNNSTATSTCSLANIV